ncbi:MAG: T9SS C-terminal target domain-containing protein [Calditrichaeota bacterium]|nr:MAG: T9SS C-terminal target domain-containing protein [Calditrichota bacterium]
MKAMLIFLIVLISHPLTAQTVPDLPISLGAGSAEVYHNAIYYFGGSNNWSGSVVYPRIYKYDGQSWAHYDSIPDNNLWDVETVLTGDDVYLISGWPNGASFLRKYNFSNRQWEYLPQSPNTSSWGVTAEYLNGHIYLFQPGNGNVYDYNISDSTWTTRNNAGITGPLNLSSILYEDEIYIIGYSDSAFVKYTPATDQWTFLSKPPYPVGASAMGIINNKIYNVGGNANGSSAAEYKKVIVYDITTDQWTTDSLTLSAKRHWMATASYQGGLYVLGGFDSTAYSVATVEEIVPQGTATTLASGLPLATQGFQLRQNYPNPFNPQTRIPYTLTQAAHVNLSVYNTAGRKVATLLNGIQAAGSHYVNFSRTSLSAGIYVYTLTVRAKGVTRQATRKMLLLK